MKRIPSIDLNSFPTYEDFANGKAPKATIITHHGKIYIKMYVTNWKDMMNRAEFLPWTQSDDYSFVPLSFLLWQEEQWNIEKRMVAMGVHEKNLDQNSAYFEGNIIAYGAKMPKDHCKICGNHTFTEVE